MIRAIVIGSLVVFTLGSVVAYRLYNKPHRSVEKESPYASMSAYELFSAFETNEAEANIRYLDKVIEVDGTVSEILSNQDGESVLLLKTGDPLFGISCTIKGGIANVKPGMPVTVKGICTGYLSDVVLTDGLLVGN
ncbi:MAG TPA: hypothetical protein VF490_04550 [Chryseosolibacter sp.]